MFLLCIHQLFMFHMKVKRGINSYKDSDKFYLGSTLGNTNATLT